MENLYKQFGFIIKKYRKDKNISSKELASRVAVSVGLISNIETSKNDVFKLELLFKLLNELEIPFTDLLSHVSSKDYDITFVEDKLKIEVSLFKNAYYKNGLLKRNITLVLNTYLDTIAEFQNIDKATEFLTTYIVEELNSLKKLKYID